MPNHKAVFKGEGGLAVVLNVIEVVGSTTLYVTDNKGLTDIESLGSTRRMMAINRSVAWRYDPAIGQE